MDQRMALASFHLEGEANQWWLEQTFREVTWDTFVDKLCTRFGPTKYEDFDEDLSKIRQEGIFRDYQQEFKRLSTRVRGWPNKALFGAML